MRDGEVAVLIPQTEIEGVLAGSVDLYHADLNAVGREDAIAVIQPVAGCQG